MNAPVLHAPSFDGTEVFRGNQLAPGEARLWEGRPLFRRVAFDVFHARGIAVYFVGLFVLDAYQAWAKHIPLPLAIHNSIPLAVIIGVAGGLLLAAAWLVTLTTRYEITDRRVILRYGMALPATLSLPYSQIVKASLAVNGDHTGDIALVLKEGNHMAYLKLWPLARAWQLSHPEPTLRGVPRAAVVGALLARSLAARTTLLAGKTEIARADIARADIGLADIGLAGPEASEAGLAAEPAPAPSAPQRLPAPAYLPRLTPYRRLAVNGPSYLKSGAAFSSSAVALIAAR